MSHFSVLVIGPDYERQLAPYHEYECTGRDDEFVIDVDVTDEVIAEFNKPVKAVRLANGTVLSRWDQALYTKVPAEKAVLEEKLATLADSLNEEEDPAGAADIMREATKLEHELRRVEMFSRNEFALPDGAIELEMSADNARSHGVGYKSLADCAEEYNGAKEIDGYFFKHTNAAKYHWYDTRTKQQVAATYGDKNLQGMQEDATSSGEFLPIQTGWVVLLLRALHAAGQRETTDNRNSASMASESDVWAFPDRVLADVGYAERVLQNLPLDAFLADWRVCSGSLSQNEDRARTPLLELQHVARACQRQHIYLAQLDQLPDHVHRMCVGGSQWDWYQVGGRWTGWLKLKPGKAGELGEPGSFGHRGEAGTADVTFKSNIDFAAMRDEAGIKAGETWDTARAIAGEVWEPWDSVRERLPIDEARKFYGGQPAIRALRESKDEQFMFEVDDDLIGTRDAYIQAARDRACVPYAIVRDGQWIAKGSMGWWGISHDSVEQATWNHRVNQMLDELPDDTLVTTIDCHI